MEHGVYLAGIKKALKQRGVTYAELASRLKMTESGIKKMLNAKDLSFRRVVQICEVLDILPGQLFSLAENASIAEVEFTREQEDALIGNRVLLGVYWCLAVEKRGLAEIEHAFKISSAELKKLLNRLTTLGLITHRRGQYHAYHSGQVRWAERSPLTKVLNQEWSALTLKRALAGALDDERVMHRLVGMKLSRESYGNLLRKLNELLDETAALSEREAVSVDRSRMHNFMALVAAVPRGVYDG
jgi:transcriptional regulator with XRE-family HTH domain